MLSRFSSYDFSRRASNKLINALLENWIQSNFKFIPKGDTIPLKVRILTQFSNYFFVQWAKDQDT